MKKVLFQIVLMVLCITAQAQKVSNVHAEQRGQEIVVFYSLETSSPCEVSLFLSQDNGATWGSALKNVSGDVGKNIAAGNKQITWNVLEEREQLVGDQIQFKVVANGKKSFEPEMVFLEGGRFQMGSDSGAPDENIEHLVTLSSFNIGKYEVTQAQWKAVMGNNPSSFSGCDNCPVENVSWDDVQDFIRKLNVQTGKNYRLPTEAEWEYAAKGGCHSWGYSFRWYNALDSIAWFTNNSRSKTHYIGSKKSNGMGIHDMMGNVREWCSDWYGAYSDSSQTNPIGSSSGVYRVFRGGSWNSNAYDCRLTFRDRGISDAKNGATGFRLVLPNKEINVILEPEMVYVEGGTFQMGSSSGDSDERPVHSVTLSSFNIGKYELTQEEWRSVMGYNPSLFTGCDDCPVEYVSWKEIEKYISKLNSQTGKNYRLPTEAEWEYAAKGGNQSEGFSYSGSNDVSSVAWTGENSNGIHAGGRKQANELGIYDLSGNVYEFCSDPFYIYSISSEINPTREIVGPQRVIRGGSWISSSINCRNTARGFIYIDSSYSDFGFRLVLPVER